MMRLFMEAQRVQRQEEELARKKQEAEVEGGITETVTGDIINNVQVETENQPEEQPQQSEQDGDDQYNLNPRGRRQHCFLYIFKKISC
jgi:hypothetical protein